MQKPLVSAMKTSRLTARVRTWLKKGAPGTDLEANTERSHRVSSTAKSGEKAKAYANDTDEHTPRVAKRAGEKPSKVFAAETPFFSAQNCSSCMLHQLEST
jgi:hypothetical protein